MDIRRATAADHDAVWEIFRSVIAAGDTYVFDPALPREDALAYWFAVGTHPYVAVEDGRVLGTYIFKANQPGLGSHVANASYMVSAAARGKGVGSALCAHSLEEAARAGFLAMQFNIVVSTNEAAIHLWKKHGFRILGTVPRAYRHRQLGLVDAHVMFRELA
ncbi:GNAT family N-acetyltransferase [Luteolibacter sp. LG18]|uniref:GNAT family N-acetyltransferase n=1 Tax=Luteolibacter sp. LG18 TaxID=2819286 RepID=UPI002B28D9E5|nr:N-acetyltransferase [Luteolibacter sp. LG18]